jgi:uncharacterized protein (DUF1501 family)
MLPLWQAGQLAFVPFAGTDDMSRSHFETQDTIEMGQAIGGTRNYASGFMGRLAVELGQRASGAISFTDSCRWRFAAGRACPTSRWRHAFDARQTALIEAMYQGQKAGGWIWRRRFPPASGRATLCHTIAEEMEASGRGAITAKGFELSARASAC